MKKRLITGAVTAVGLILSIIGVAGYEKAGEKINQNDPMFFVIFAGVFLFLIGAVLFGNTFFEKEQKPMDSGEKVKRMTQAALFAALAYVGFQVFRFDIPVGTEKTAFHLGNTFVVLAALLLGGTWGGLSGAVGLTIADLTSGYVTSAPKTFFLKLCIGLIVGLVAHRMMHLTKEKNPKKVAVITFIASACGMLFNVVADPLTGYFYKKVLFGIPQEIASALAKMSAVTTFVNAVVAVMLAGVFYLALRPALKKAGLLIEL